MTKPTAERLPTAIGRLPGRRILSVALLGLLGTGVACKPKHKTAQAPPAAAPDTTVAEEPPPPAAPVVVEAGTPIRPTCDQYTVGENGVGGVQLGDPSDTVRTRCVIASDSTTRDGQGWSQGHLVVGVNSSPLDVEIGDNNVRSLAVTDTLFRTLDGLGPGTPVTRLLNLPGALVLEGQHDLAIVVGSHCGLYFQIPKPATLPEGGQRWLDVVMAMPPTTPIERVRVRGCRTPTAS